MGVLGWTPYEYYCSSPYEFHCACEGYSIKLDHHAQLHRAGASIVHASLVKKPLPPYKLWPLKGDKSEVENLVWGSTKEEAKAMWEQVKKAHNIK